MFDIMQTDQRNRLRYYWQDIAHIEHRIPGKQWHEWRITWKDSWVARDDFIDKTVINAFDNL